MEISTPTELTERQRKMVDKMLQAGFNRGIASVAKLLKTISINAKEANKAEPPLCLIAEAIEKRIKPLSS